MQPFCNIIHHPHLGESNPLTTSWCRLFARLSDTIQPHTPPQTIASIHARIQILIRKIFEKQGENQFTVNYLARFKQDTFFTHASFYLMHKQQPCLASYSARKIEKQKTREHVLSELVFSVVQNHEKLIKSQDFREKYKWNDFLGIIVNSLSSLIQRDCFMKIMKDLIQRNAFKYVLIGTLKVSNSNLKVDVTEKLIACAFKHFSMLSHIAKGSHSTLEQKNLFQRITEILETLRKIIRDLPESKKNSGHSQYVQLNVIRTRLWMLQGKEPHDLVVVREIEAISQLICSP